ncbi:MAG: hypothetical protein M1837_005649 [Sclerophora amabilis]|nr:MAG: hypothetical protein M1837_005649 [Sclerophora amabilis]
MLLVRGGPCGFESLTSHAVQRSISTAIRQVSTTNPVTVGCLHNRPAKRLFSSGNVRVLTNSLIIPTSRTRASIWDRSRWIDHTIAFKGDVLHSQVGRHIREYARRSAPVSPRVRRQQIAPESEQPGQPDDGEAETQPLIVQSWTYLSVGLGTVFVIVVVLLGLESYLRHSTLEGLDTEAARRLSQRKDLYSRLAAQYGGDRFLHRMFSYRPFEWLQSPVVPGMVTYITYQFAHSGLMHLLFNTLSANYVVTSLGLVMGSGKILFTFILGGFLAANIHCAIERALNPNAKLSAPELQARVEDYVRVQQEESKRSLELKKERLQAKPDELAGVAKRQAEAEPQVSWMEYIRRSQRETELTSYLASGVGASSSVICLGTYPA